MIDRIFKAYDVRATYPVPLNEEMPPGRWATPPRSFSSGTGRIFRPS